MKYEDTLGKILFDEETIARRVAELGAQISADYEREYPGEPVLCVTILKGGAIFACDILRRLTVDARIDFMAVSSYGASTKSSGIVRIIKDLDEPLEGKDVLVVEDIVDSGRTVSYLTELFRDRKAASIRYCTLLDKPERRVVDLDMDYVGFRIPDKFVVGYGMDYDQRYRNLPYIGVVRFDED